MLKEKLKFLSFWAINDNLNLDKMKLQLLQLKELGLDGVVFQPRNYPGNPEYLSLEYMNILSEIILYAKLLNIKFWLYDENGWPSGRAGGLVNKRYPEAKCYYLMKTEEGIKVQSKDAISSLDPAAGKIFLEETFERYRKGLKAEAFDYVEGFFSDEVGYLDGFGASLTLGGVPWCEEIAPLYEKKYKESLLDSLHLLFEDGEECQKVRYQYWETLNELLVDSFYRPINEWCSRYKKKYTAHVKGEENPYFQVSFSSSCYQILKNVSVPAVDALERYSGNAYYPRIASSVAKQFHSGESLCEAIGGSGWGLSPEDFINYISWLVQCGIKTFVLHLQQFQLKGEAIRDWPPSLPLHMTWKHGLTSVIQEIRQWEKEFGKEEEKKPIFLLVAPTRGVMGGFRPGDSKTVNIHDGSNVPNSTGGRISNEFMDFVEQCSNLRIRFDVTEEKILEEHANITSDGVQIGHTTYEKVILSNGCLWENEDIIKVIKENGFLMARESLRQRDYRQEEVRKSKKLSLSQTPWKYINSGENQLLLPFNTNQNLVYECCIRIQNEMELKNIYLYSSDLADDIIFNGYKLEKKTDKDGFIYPIPDKLVRTPLWNIKIDVSCSPEKEPFIYIRGQFLVFSTDNYSNKGKREVITKGPFYLSGKIEKVNCSNFIESGFPFIGTEITISKEFTNAELLMSNSLKFAGVFADMLKIRIDDRHAYIHGSDWSVPFEIKPGTHEMELTCYPSTYNTYGPHQYMGGDYKIISPAQYKGIKNFADPTRFPKKTCTDSWNFVKFGIEKELNAYAVSYDKRELNRWELGI
ncbi:hypothetical protein [Anaerocolumna sp. MB42-C2]|uniref:hypothetical protein n=1 Tax=Anaerocolumna sp. MB42-C2 TaxID=3070997 RepID=UPI0027DF8C45|nr:hypothetical protein [Anaerocolumna sp. MB42-C2]WMJ86196.1 hypothetical protein RBU59_19425 [Anaerocolumna sp. MB42-C2]